jgi:hypothetical protein
MKNQIKCPHCRSTISNDSDLDYEGKDAGLVSTFVYCECGEKISFRKIIAQISDPNNQLQESNFGFMCLPWLEG